MAKTTVKTKDQKRAERDAAAAADKAQLAGSTGTINAQGEFTKDPPGKSIYEDV